MMSGDRDEIQDVYEPRPSASEERESRLSRRNYQRPAVDIYSTEDKMVVLADMPGARKEDLDLLLDKDELVIEARVHGRREEESALPWGYQRRFRLRTAFDRKAIRAKLRGGILEVTLPKAARERSQKISID